MTFIQFVEQQGAACPSCASEELNWHDEQVDSDLTATVMIPASCQNCGAQWEAVYDLNRFAKLRNGDPKKIWRG